MIPAKHQKWANGLFSWYLGHLFRRHFHQFHLLGEVPSIDQDLPLLLTPNHSSWWDGFFVHFLNRKIFDRRLYMMMLEEQLQKFPFFKRVGAYSIDPDNPLATIRSLNYSLNQLQHPRNLVCIFPQGELLPFGTSPFEYRSGISWLLARQKQIVQVLPLAIRIEARSEQLPDVFFKFGQVRVSKNGSGIPEKTLQEEQSSLRDELRSLVDSGETGHILFEGKASLSERYQSKKAANHVFAGANR